MPEFVYVVQADYYGEADFGGVELVASEVLGVFKNFEDAENFAETSCYTDDDGFQSPDAYVLNMELK